MSSATRGGPGIAAGKHPTAIRLWRENGEIVCSRCGMDLDWDESSPSEMYGDKLPDIMENDNVWFCCKPCIDKMPDAPGFMSCTDSDGNEYDVEITQ